MTKPLMIWGATGNQGGAVIDQVLKLPNASEFSIVGVTRNPAGGSAQRIAKKSPSIKMVQGDYSDIAAAFKEANAAFNEPIWGVYSIQIFKSIEQEESQGQGLVDAALKNGVKHFVYASCDRGGDEKSWDDPTPIPHVISKYHNELYLRDHAKGTQMTWSILRPTAFMENIAPGFPTKVMLSAWKRTVKEKPVQIVACQDIGYFAAQSFADPQKWNGRGIALAGDCLSYDQVQEKTKQVLGYPVPAGNGIFGFLFMNIMTDFAIMFRWFYDVGFGADMKALKQMNPNMYDFETYLRELSTFEKQK